MSYYEEDEDVEYRVRRNSSRPVRFVERPRHDIFDEFLLPEQRGAALIRPRSRSRDRSPNPPVIINNKIYNEHSSDEEDEYHRRRQVIHRRRSSGSRSRSRSRAEWEAESTRRQLEQMRLDEMRDKESRRLSRGARNDAELQLAKLELDELKRRETRAEDKKRIARELELQRLRDEEAEAEEKKRREKEAKEAVERYKQHEIERIEKEKRFKEETEKEYRRRLQEDLLKAGVDEKDINAILEKKKIGGADNQLGRPTYTRMARRHLSIETLRAFSIEFDMDSDPEFILIKRWVPEWEQDKFWKHTRYIREKRGSGALIVEERRHRRDGPEFEWVRKKSDRKRSKSPGGLLMYLSGARPA